MNQSSFIGLVYNAALLMALVVVFDSITIRRTRNLVLYNLLTGTFISIIVLAIMYNPWVLEPGVVFDTRSILLSISALFFGFIPTAIASVLAILYRLSKGGAGAFGGTLVILASLAWGLIWRRIHHIWRKPYRFWEFFTLGVFNHATMMLILWIFIAQSRNHLVSVLTLPVMTIYPLVTVILGMISSRRLQRLEEHYQLDDISHRLKAILASVPDIIMEVDLNKIYTWSNQAGFDFFGEDVIGKEAAYYFLGNQRTYEITEVLFEGSEEIVYVESWQRRKDGEKRLLAWWCKVLKDETGITKGAISTARDITREREDELAVREIQSRFEQFMDQIPGNAFIKDKESKLLYVNKHMIDDHNANEWIGKLPQEIFETEVAKEILDDDQEALRLGCKQMQDCYQQPDGTNKYYETMKFTIERDDGDILIGGISLDVTDRIKAEQERNVYAQRMEILHSTDKIVLENISLKDASNTILRELTKLIPYTSLSITVCAEDQYEVVAVCNTDLKFDYINSFIPLPENTTYRDILEKKAIVIDDTSTIQTEENSLLSRLIEDGIKSMMYIALVVQEEMLGYLCFASVVEGFFTSSVQEIALEFSNQLSLVINQLKLMQAAKQYALDLELKVEQRTNQLQRINQDLETFSYSVAHDLRAPLRTIDGFSNILLEDYSASLDDNAKQYLTRIKDNAVKMGQLITALLDLARVTKDNMRYRNTDMQKIVSEVLEELSPEKGDKEYVFDIGELPAVYADSDLIFQVWENLIANAIRFSQPKEERHIIIGSTTEEERIIYYVKDNGIGFDMKYYAKLFNAFQRLHRVEDFTGTGIGLAIVKKIVQRHNGEVWAEGEVGNGAAFYFTLPTGSLLHVDDNVIKE